MAQQSQRLPTLRRLLRTRQRRLLLLTVLLISLVTVGLWCIRLDPEPTLAPGEGDAIVAAFRLPSVPRLPPLPIAKRVHFMYKSLRMEGIIRPYLLSWRRAYPDYELFFWTDKEIEELVARKYPTWRNLYHNKLSIFLERSDIARAFILHAFGGWYSDVDGWCLRSAESVVQLHGLILPLEPYLHAMANFNKYQLASNAIMYSTAGHPFWLYFLQYVSKSLDGRPPRTDTKGAAVLTGPVAITAAALLYNQAHSRFGCPSGPWCPYLAAPLQFMPTYDNTENMRRRLRFHCTFTFRHKEFLENCKYYEKYDYRNHIDLNVSYTYHEFMHINDRSQEYVRNGSDVRGWGLRLLTGPDIVAMFAKVGDQ